MAKATTNPTTKKKGGRKHRDWRPVFLASLSQCGNMTVAAKKAGVHRVTACDEKAKNPEFKKACDAAMDQACDLLEKEAYRRGVIGVKRPVTIAGEREIVQEYSDVLLIFLLKGGRPEKFKDRWEGKLNAEHVHRVAGQSPEQLNEQTANRVRKLLEAKAN